MGGTDVGSETFGGSPPNGAGAGSGVGSTFAKGAGKIGVAEEDIVGPAPTREAVGGNVCCVVSGGPEFVG